MTSIRIWTGYFIAALLGVVLASYQPLAKLLEETRKGDENRESAVTATAPPQSVPAPAPAIAIAAPTGGEQILQASVARPPIAMDTQIIAAAGMRLAPARKQGRFIGYRVLASPGDARVQIDQVITAINGVPVEDTAAGGELLIAGLANPQTKITVINRTAGTPN